jgi:putative ABC transport system permease protein
MNWTQDFRFALRMIWKKPWFSAAIVVTLALGMGINTTVFSLVNAVLFKPLPFSGGDRLVMAWFSNSATDRTQLPVSYPDFRDFQQSTDSFERLEVFSPSRFIIAENGNPPELYQGAEISAGMFAMLKTQPVLGRAMQTSDEKPGAQKVALISYGVWKDRYGKNPSAIGRAVRINEKATVIIGVMPEGFRFPNREDIWTAIVPDAAAEDRNQRRYTMIGMLKEGSSIAAAHADLEVIAKRLEKQYPDTNKGYGTTLLTFHQAMNGGQVRILFLLMMGAVGFVLLIACANVANMLLSRATERIAEVSIRTAIGASRWRIVRQLLVESVLLAAMGGLVGLALSSLGVRAFGKAVAQVDKPYWIDFSMNYVVFGYFAAITIFAGIVFGIAPALSASRVNLNQALKEGRGLSGARGGYLSGTLVVLQFILAVALLSGAGLMVRSFLAAENEFSGIHGEQVLATRIHLPENHYAKETDRQQFFDRLMPRLAAIPGVQQVALISNPPGTGGNDWPFEIAGKLNADAKNRPEATYIVAGKGYFSLLGMNIVRGRDFEDSDGLPGKETVIVSQSFASRFFPNQDPLGKQIRLYDPDNKPKAWMTIIAVSPDIRQFSSSMQSSDPLIVLPYDFQNRVEMFALLRTQVSPSDLTATVRSEVQQMDQDMPLFDTMTLAKMFQRNHWYLSVFGTVFFIFAVVAIGMAALGLYAVMAYAVGRRTREIGVRMALGANVGSILRLVLARGVKQLALGLFLGLAAGLAVCRLMAGFLLKVSPNDPLTFILVALTLIAAGLMASWFPARRAARLDPVKALRYE